MRLNTTMHSEIVLTIKAWKLSLGRRARYIPMNTKACSNKQVVMETGLGVVNHKITAKFQQAKPVIKVSVYNLDAVYYILVSKQHREIDSLMGCSGLIDSQPHQHMQKTLDSRHLPELVSGTFHTGHNKKHF